MDVLEGNKTDNNNGQANLHAIIINIAIELINVKVVQFTSQYVIKNSCISYNISCNTSYSVTTNESRNLVINLEVMFATIFLVVIESRMSVNESTR